MLEVKLIAIFFVCTAFLIISGIIIVRSAGKAENSPRIFMILPVGKNTSDIEFIVRDYIYKAAGKYPETMILFCDLGADKDTVYIFEKLMEFSCNYFIMDYSDLGQNFSEN